MRKEGEYVILNERGASRFNSFCDFLPEALSSETSFLYFYLMYAKDCMDLNKKRQIFCLMKHVFIRFCRGTVEIWWRRFVRRCLSQLLPTLRLHVKRPVYHQLFVTLVTLLPSCHSRLVMIFSFYFLSRGLLVLYLKPQWGRRPLCLQLSAGSTSETLQVWRSLIRAAWLTHIHTHTHAHARTHTRTQTHTHTSRAGLVVVVYCWGNNRRLGERW